MKKIEGIGITWLGHATFLLETPEGKTILVDPWTASNPFCPEAYHDVKPDAILVTHGHNDHVGDLIKTCKDSGAPAVCIYEIAMWLGRNGITNAIGMNKGGTVSVDAANVSVTMTNAHHSSAFFEDDGTVHYLGEPAGFVITFSNDARFYFAGDTCLFGDMALIGELWSPTVGVLPIGDHFTMDPRQAAYAAELTGVSTVIPTHYASFPMLSGTPEQLEAELEKRGVGAKVVTLPIG